MSAQRASRARRSRGRPPSARPCRGSAPVAVAQLERLAAAGRRARRHRRAAALARGADTSTSTVGLPARVEDLPPCAIRSIITVLALRSPSARCAGWGPGPRLAEADLSCDAAGLLRGSATRQTAIRAVGAALHARLDAVDAARCSSGVSTCSGEPLRRDAAARRAALSRSAKRAASCRSWVTSTAPRRSRSLAEPGAQPLEGMEPVAEVQVRGRLVEQQHVALLRESARQQHALPLAARELEAARSRERVDPERASACCGALAVARRSRPSRPRCGARPIATISRTLNGNGTRVSCGTTASRGATLAARAAIRERRTAQPHRARAGASVPASDAQQRGLARRRWVRPGPSSSPAHEREVDASQHRLCAEANSTAVGLERARSQPLPRAARGAAAPGRAARRQRGDRADRQLASARAACAPAVSQSTGTRRRASADAGTSSGGPARRAGAAGAATIRPTKPIRPETETDGADHQRGRDSSTARRVRGTSTPSCVATSSPSESRLSACAKGRRAREPEREQRATAPSWRGSTRRIARSATGRRAPPARDPRRSSGTRSAARRRR